MLHQILFIFQFTCLKLIVNYCIKHGALYVNDLYIHWATIYILSWTTKKHQKILSRLLHSKLKKIQALFEDLHRNLRTFQGLFKTVRTLLTYQKTEENTFKSRMKSTCNMYLILVAHLPKQNQQFLVKADFLARIWKVGLKLKRTKNINVHIIAMISHNKKTKIWHCIQRISQASPV